MKKKKGIIKKIVIGVLIIIFAVALAGWLFLNHFIHRGLPQITGELQLAGLIEAVTVTRDEFGVAHIAAVNEQDLFMAQGFIHAQDRLFQMDLGRRQASGRLSEVFGAMAVSQDMYFHTLLLKHYAEASFAVQSDETIEILTWYAAGVNAFIEQAIANNNLPVEFHILGYQPEPWTVYDSLTFAKFKAYDLAGHWEGQAFRGYLLQNFEEAQAFELFPSYPDGAPYVINPTDLNLSSLFRYIMLPDEHNGSNNWVLDGSMTASGMPMLSDDPHLALGTPSIWYHNHLRGGRFHVNGVSIAGVPGIVLGHNPYIAWGVTNTGPDVQDLFIERRNPENPHQFLFDGEWLDATVLQKRIYVDGADPIDFEVVITRNGPIISELANFNEAGYALSLRWTAHAPTAELDAILGFNRARNWEEFSVAGAALIAPAQNFVFAAMDGTIAFKVIGQIPIRANGRIPYTPVPGWIDDYGWVGFIPYEQMPTVVNPVDGFIASANNKVVGDDYPFFITNQWAQPYRQMRIIELLYGRENLTVEDMIAIQIDNKNLEAVEFLQAMLSVLERRVLSARAEEAINHLSTWDYFDEVDRTGATIFNTWMREIQSYLFQEAISEDMWPLFRRRASFVNELFRRNLNGEHVIWIEENGGMEHVLEATLENTLVELESMLGRNMNHWEWGNFHQVAFRHPLSNVSPLHILFNPRDRIATPGSGVTVNQAAFARDGLTTNGAGWRFVIDLGDTNTSHMIVAPGNSGHPRSPFYHNNIDLWIEGGLYETSLNIPNGYVLVLRPEQ
ncbi:MAG: penicillin acylase family protein [Defluviitaleaceae bacterium]|nr:penicillin acylase family protein [Defluviitaleaceae bacterium]